MNGINPTTGTVHSGHKDKALGVGHLMQDCGTSIYTQRASLAPTEEPLTCKRCIAAEARKAAEKAATVDKAKKAAAKPASTGPAAWGVFTAAGEMRTWRQTRTAAQAVAEAGESVSKL